MNSISNDKMILPSIILRMLEVILKLPSSTLFQVEVEAEIEISGECTCFGSLPD